MLLAVWSSIHTNAKPPSVSHSGRTSSSAEQDRVPRKIIGRRRPQRVWSRSLAAPNSGGPITETTPPQAITSPSPRPSPSVPTIAVM